MGAEAFLQCIDQSDLAPAGREALRSRIHSPVGCGMSAQRPETSRPRQITLRVLQSGFRARTSAEVKRRVNPHRRRNGRFGSEPCISPFGVLRYLAGAQRDRHRRIALLLGGQRGLRQHVVLLRGTTPVGELVVDVERGITRVALSPPSIASHTVTVLLGGQRPVGGVLVPAQQRGDALGIEGHPVLHRTSCSSPATTPRGCTPTYRVAVFDLFTGPVPGPYTVLY